MLEDETWLTAFQSTHPHGVRPGADGGFLVPIVSIHAPARGATVNDRVYAGA